MFLLFERWDLMKYMNGHITSSPVLICTMSVSTVPYMEQISNIFSCLRAYMLQFSCNKFLNI